MSRSAKLLDHKMKKPFFGVACDLGKVMRNKFFSCLKVSAISKAFPVITFCKWWRELHELANKKPCLFSD